MSLIKINRLVSVMEMRFVASDIRIDYLYIINTNFVLQRVTSVVLSIKLTKLTRRYIMQLHSYFLQQKLVWEMGDYN
jgi:hypothetical protein